VPWLVNRQAPVAQSEPPEMVRLSHSPAAIKPSANDARGVARVKWNHSSRSVFHSCGRQCRCWQFPKRQCWTAARALANYNRRMELNPYDSPQPDKPLSAELKPRPLVGMPWAPPASTEQYRTVIHANCRGGGCGTQVIWGNCAPSRRVGAAGVQAGCAAGSGAIGGSLRGRAG